MRAWIFLVLVACGTTPEDEEKAGDADADADSDADADADSDADSDADADVVLNTIPVDAAGLVGRSYVLNMADGDWIKPPGGTLAGDDVDILMGVISADANAVNWRAATMDGNQQDLCVTTQDWPTGVFTTNPTWAGGPINVTTEIDGVVIVYEDFFFGGTFEATAGAHSASAT